MSSITVGAATLNSANATSGDPITVTFSEAVTGFDAKDLVLPGGVHVGGLATSDGGTTWSGTLTADAGIARESGGVSVSMADPWTDGAGNPGAPGEQRGADRRHAGAERPDHGHAQPAECERRGDRHLHVQRSRQRLRQQRRDGLGRPARPDHADWRGHLHGVPDARPQQHRAGDRHGRRRQLPGPRRQPRGRAAGSGTFTGDTLAPTGERDGGPRHF